MLQDIPRGSGRRHRMSKRDAGCPDILTTLERSNKSLERIFKIIIYNGWKTRVYIWIQRPFQLVRKVN